MILGFDVSKDKLDGVLINKRGEVLESFVVLNNREDISCLLKIIKDKHSKIIVASEATAEYHRCLAFCCFKLNIPFYLLNPILTKQFTRGTVRKKKTDLSDALVIAKLTLQGEGSLIDKDSFSSLKTVNRTSYKLTRIHQMIHLMRKRIKEFLPEEKDLIGVLDKNLFCLDKSIKAIKKRVDSDIDSQLKELLCSIPGIGSTLANTLIVEIGDINRFKDQKSLVAFAGLDPKVKQSGKTLKRNTRLTKRGSPYLRRAVFLAASIAQRHDPQLKEYYLKKRSEGKRYKEATCAAARKLLFRVYAVWKRRTPYIKCSSEIIPASSRKVLT